MKNLKIKAEKLGNTSRIIISSGDIAITRLQFGRAVAIITRGKIPSLRQARVMIKELAKFMEDE